MTHSLFDCTCYNLDGAAVVLLFFALIGDTVLTLLGITLHYIMTAGGIYILIFAVKSSLGSVSAPGGTQNSDGKAAGLSKEDAEKLAIVPIGTPFLAGPGAIAAAMILNDDPSGVTTTIIAIIVNVLLAYLILRFSNRLTRMITPSSLQILNIIMDILIAAIGVAFLFNGISAAYKIHFT